MASTPVRITPRDLDILKALERTPLTARQLLKLSETFALRFTSERKVRLRLQALGSAGQVRQGRYVALAGRGAGTPKYYLLSPLGFRLLHDDATAPRRRHAFEAVGIAREHHTHALAEFIVH